MFKIWFYKINKTHQCAPAHTKLGECLYKLLSNSDKLTSGNWGGRGGIKFFPLLTDAQTGSDSKNGCRTYPQIQFKVLSPTDSKTCTEQTLFLQYL